MNTNQITGWLKFNYEGKERSGLAIGPDTRPNTNNIICLTVDGVRAFKVSKITDLVNETVVYA